MLAGVARLDIHHRVISALVAAAITGAVMHGHPIWTLSLATYDAFASVSLALLLVTVALTPPGQIRLVAQKQNAGRTIVFGVVISAGCSALFAVAFLIRDVRKESHHDFALHLLLVIGTIVLSWLLMHTLFGIRYAHNFYVNDDSRAHKQTGGLDFPGESKPDYRDFAYFSFVIGMTCQVSDVQVTSRDMRRLVLLHGILAFAFNTVILALSINTVSSLL